MTDFDFDKQAPRLEGFVVLTDYNVTNKYNKRSFATREEALEEAKKCVGRRYSDDETYFVAEYKITDKIVERPRTDNYTVEALV